MEKQNKSVPEIVLGAISGLIMIVCILVYIILGVTLNFWHPGWLIIVSGALGVAIINIVTNLIRDIKALKEDEKKEQEKKD